MTPDALWSSLWPLPPAGRAALAALATAAAWAGLLRLLNRRDLAALGPALGIAVGWAVTLGLPFASPRQLAERLPLLALAGFVGALLLTLLAATRASTLALGAALLLAAGAWWLAGAPVTTADLRTALVPLLALGAAAAVASLELRSPLRSVAAFVLALAALWIARPSGPWPILAAAGVAAAVGGFPAGAPWTAAIAAPMALALCRPFGRTGASPRRRRRLDRGGNTLRGLGPGSGARGAHRRHARRDLFSVGRSPAACRC